mmetsp:Transcript_1702/g.3627  ORF Transcript_1702/g.3627 Transcript_1702/m.3627 type:complete len:270 (-) Transcript_1702:231-1040(-)|eukprot:CAMPEP_0172314728 /NCGR_PEP_ID=MMETSP1058-20130122/23270_1 /TAXON_ID=83371 /ORGANISM="Detonula confervacea, Strain CCMP 353" /LENGTH=269 /DNA_ID=CAMNT_0013028667 /DNA_START=40 /DNA_END=849 /DNA_ORIENTATION=-
MTKRARLFALLLLLPPAASLLHCRDINHSTTSFISSGSRCNGGQNSYSRLYAKRKDRKGSSGGGSRRKKHSGTNGNVLTSPPSSAPIDIPELSSATQSPPATLAGVVEDHRYEQFFYDNATTNQLYQLVDLYERPLLLCNPTLAVMAEKKGRPYKLLDRDTRFDFLGGYEAFSLTEPHLITGYEFDAVFIDPPFANVTPEQVARCLRLMGADRVPLWVAYNSRREEKLLESMNALDCPSLEPKWRLSYKEGVSEITQGSIWLYGPKDGH